MAEVNVIIGHLRPRARSENRRIAEVALEHHSDTVSIELVDGLDELPFYHEDIDS